MGHEKTLLVFRITVHRFCAVYAILVFITACSMEDAIEPPGIPPIRPVLSSPADDAYRVQVPLTLSWTECEAATGYSLQVSTDFLFSNLICNQTGIKTNSYYIANVDSNKTYYWRAKASNDYGTSEWSLVKSFRTIPKYFKCGSTITYSDEVYNTVLIGQQCWFKQNLNVGKTIEIHGYYSDNGIIEKSCRRDSAHNCDLLGGWYSWNEAMQYSRKEYAKGICPDGWHIPTLNEFEILKQTVNGDANSLKEIGEGYDNGLNGIGTNTSGFSALMASGYFFTSLEIRDGALFWTSTEVNLKNADDMILNYFNNIVWLGPHTKTHLLSVRCVSD